MSVENTVRKSGEDPDKRVLVRLFLDWGFSVRDMAYVLDMTEDQILEVVKNPVPDPEYEEQMSLPKTAEEAEEALCKMRTEIYDEKSILYYACLALRQGMLARKKIAEIFSVNESMLEYLEIDLDMNIRRLKSGRTLHADMVRYNAEDYEIDWESVPLDTWVEFRREHETVRYHFAGMDFGGRVRVYERGKSSWTSGDSCTVSVPVENLWLVRQEDFEKYAWKREKAEILEAKRGRNGRGKRRNVH